MNISFNFLFWASGYFFLLCILYNYLIKPLKNPSLGRFYIMGGLLISLIMGLGFRYGSTGINLQETGLITLPEVVIYASETIENSKEVFQGLVFSTKELVYTSLAISFLFFLRFAAGIIFLVARWRLLGGFMISGVLVIPVNGNQTPYSFFGLVFIPQHLLGDASLNSILLHEKAHIKKLHSVDLVLMEVLTIFFWFHPALWFLRRELKLQHEYAADRYVLGQNVDKIAYQQLLVNFSFKSYCFPVTNPFNVSPLKKRIAMMNQPTPKPGYRAFLGFMTTALLFAFLFLMQSNRLQADLSGKTSVVSKIENAVFELTPATSEFQISSGPQFSQANFEQQPPLLPEAPEDPIFLTAEVLPSFPGGMDAFVQFLKDNLVYPQEARLSNTQGTVFVSFVVEKDGRLTNIKVIRGIGKGCDEEAMRVIKAMPKWVPASQRGETVRLQFNVPIRFVLNRNESDQDDTDGQAFIRIPGAENVVVYVDGKKIETGVENLNNIITPDRIESVKVLKGEEARTLYGHENGVVVITSKQVNNP